MCRKFKVNAPIEISRTSGARLRFNKQPNRGDRPLRDASINFQGARALTRPTTWKVWS